MRGGGERERDGEDLLGQNTRPGRKSIFIASLRKAAMPATHARGKKERQQQRLAPGILHLLGTELATGNDDL